MKARLPAQKPGDRPPRESESDRRQQTQKAKILAKIAEKVFNDVVESVQKDFESTSFSFVILNLTQSMEDGCKGTFKAAELLNVVPLQPSSIDCVRLRMTKLKEVDSKSESESDRRQLILNLTQSMEDGCKGTFKAAELLNVTK
jgi:hypothetical protein